MARPLRIEYEGAVYHVTSRGNERNSIFKDDADRRILLDIIEKVNKRYKILCHAYCLMDNHYHLVIETPDANLSKGMKQLNSVYTQTFNKRHKRVGHVFQGRYKSILIQKESHLLEVCRYIVLNPVRAKIADEPEKWKWGSYRATVGLEKGHPCLTRDWILGQFAERKKTAQKKYKEFVVGGIGEKSLWGEVKGQSILGEDNFVDALIGYVKGYEEIEEIPKSQRYINRPGLDELFHNTSFRDKYLRNRKIVEAIYKFGYSQKEVADQLGMHYTSISRILSKMLKVKT